MKEYRRRCALAAAMSAFTVLMPSIIYCFGIKFCYGYGPLTGWHIVGLVLLTLFNLWWFPYIIKKSLDWAHQGYCTATFGISPTDSERNVPEGTLMRDDAERLWKTCEAVKIPARGTVFQALLKQVLPDEVHARQKEECKC